jgi:general stress protein 26
MSHQSSAEEDVDRLWEIVSPMRACMMVTCDSGQYRARPMAPIVRAEENAIYFFLAS